MKFGGNRSVNILVRHKNTHTHTHTHRTVWCHKPFLLRSGCRPKLKLEYSVGKADDTRVCRFYYSFTPAVELLTVLVLKSDNR